MLDFSPQMLWEYGKLLLLSALIGTVIGFFCTYAARKLFGKKDVRKDLRKYLFHAVVFSLFLCALSLAQIWGRAPLSSFLFAALTEVVRFLVIPWTAAMVMTWGFIPPWQLLSPNYYKGEE